MGVAEIGRNWSTGNKHNLWTCYGGNNIFAMKHLSYLTKCAVISFFPHLVYYCIVFVAFGFSFMRDHLLWLLCQSPRKQLFILHHLLSRNCFSHQTQQRGSQLYPYIHVLPSVAVFCAIILSIFYAFRLIIQLFFYHSTRLCQQVESMTWSISISRKCKDYLSLML